MRDDEGGALMKSFPYRGHWTSEARGGVTVMGVHSSAKSRAAAAFGLLATMAIAYRYYSLFLANRVMGLDDSRITPAHARHDGQNYHATSRGVLFGHHFAAISGAVHNLGM